jgi:hypothetical protein
MAGPSRPRIPHDPVRAKLESVREGLLAREAELLASEMGAMSVDVKEEPMEMKVELGSSPLSPTTSMGRRGSGTPGGSRSGKQRALDLIRQGESDLPPGAILLYVRFSSPSSQISVKKLLTFRPIEQTLALGNRDYTTQTLDSFTHLSLAKKKEKTYDPLDENARAQALARMNNFMSYKGDADIEEGEEDEGMFGFDDGEYEGDDDRMGTSGHTARGTGERIDEFGEDEEVWAEGAEDEYTLRGGDLES